FFTSKDGTRVPMFISHKKNIKLDGTNPTIMYGYGGFAISLRAGFSTTRQVWLEQGGIWVTVNLRGGGEFGESWHNAGQKLNKQNVFDDFFAAAEYLIDNNYTSPKHLGIMGGSNGGLLVAACMTQRPELFNAAIPEVGVLDMLRYDNFTAGRFWVSEYGSAHESPQMFRYLLSYSPYHNIRTNVDYPATMVMTADTDDRVVPAHSFKFTARLQELYQGTNPMLIRVQHKAGHGSGKPTRIILQEQADIYAFFWNNLK
ncbi:MAG: S9 family peptidase, partial [Sedimentisphaerales bacterium]|nr:S9 family peptidase [Sedimentisphaerales bacterium]